MVDVDELNLDPVVRAQGVALAVVGVLLERRGGLPKGEFSRLLGLMTTLTAETDAEAADILAAWTGVAQTVATQIQKAGLKH